MKRDDGARARAYQLLAARGIEAEVVVGDVAEDGLRAAGEDGLVIGHEVVRSSDHLVAGLDTRGQQRDVQGRRAGGGGHHLPLLQFQEAADLLLEGLGERSHAEPPDVEGVRHRLDRVHADGGLEDGDAAHSQRTAQS